MCNLKDSIEKQKKVNEAVEAIYHYLDSEVKYTDLLEEMAEAQVSIMQLMELNRYIATCDTSGIDSVVTDSVTNFIVAAHEAYKLLKPFAKIMGQIE